MHAKLWSLIILDFLLFFSMRCFVTRSWRSATLSCLLCTQTTNPPVCYESSWWCYEQEYRHHMQYRQSLQLSSSWTVWACSRNGSQSHSGCYRRGVSSFLVCQQCRSFFITFIYSKIVCALLCRWIVGGCWLICGGVMGGGGAGSFLVFLQSFWRMGLLFIMKIEFVYR